VRKDEAKDVKDVIDPLDFFDVDLDEDMDNTQGTAAQGQSVAMGQPSAGAMLRRPEKVSCSYFITGTDTGVGKTIVTYVLGKLLQANEIDVGIMKPVQCGGEDIQFLQEALKLTDDMADMNPYAAKEPLSPHLAFRRQRTQVDVQTILKAYERLKARHECLLVEGVGGLCVPLTDRLMMTDLIKAMDIEIIIVARLGLGSINHTLMTIQQARHKGIPIKGVIFNTSQEGTPGLVEKTNPDIIKRLGRVPVLGIVPYLQEGNDKEVVARCRRSLNVHFLTAPRRSSPTQEWQSWDKKYLWHPFTQMKDWTGDDPLIIEQAKGSYLIDTQGRRYLDGVSSLWANVHGHGKEGIDEAVKTQINQLSHSTLLGLSHPPAIKLAKRLVEIAPRGLAKVFYSDNGSTAVEVAIKMAYQYWQNMGKPEKSKFAHLHNAYHGDTLGSVSVGGIDLFHEVYRKLLVETITCEFPDGYRAPEGKTYPEYYEECLAKMEQMFAAGHHQIAAMVVEPMVQGAAGIRVWPPGVLTRIRKMCETYDIFFIADEVATGFGRTGKMFACDHEQVTPDFLCLAKGLTGGYLPLAATLTTERVYDGFSFDYKEQKTFFHGHTYTGNPLGCAAALANLRIFERGEILHKIQPKIKFLSEKLPLFYNLAHVGHVRQCGLMVGVELVKDKEHKTPYSWEEQIGIQVCRRVRERGVILRPLGNVIVLMPPLSIKKQEMEHLLETTYWAIEEVTTKG
jgi:adenosylmethionine-8-amino-7-oxononanoate aminotransferase